METNHNTKKSEQTAQYRAQKAPATPTEPSGLPLSSLTDEQLSDLMIRIEEIRRQKTLQDAPTRIDIPPIPTHVTAEEAPCPPVPHAESEQEAVLRRADAALWAMEQAEQEDAGDGDAIIFPDPACFEDLGEAPIDGVDFDPSMSSYTGQDVAPITQGQNDADDNDIRTRTYMLKTPADLHPLRPSYGARPLSSDDMDDETISVYRNLIKRRRRQRGFLYTLIALILILFLLIGGVFLFLHTYSPSVDHTPPSWGDGGSTDDASSSDNAPVIEDRYDRRSGVYNFLVLGIDRVANLSDVIMIVSYDVKAGSLNFLSLPRDTYINVGASYHKLNAYFSASYNRSPARGAERYRDAIESLATFLENNLCIRIDRYVCMDIAGFREIIDTIGGIDMEVPFDMDYEDPEQNLYIHLKAGYQHLTGALAEQFVRYRSGYLEGDIGRISAQRLFLSALVSHIQSRLDLSTAISAAKTAANHIITDMNAAEIGYFAKNAFSLDMDRILFTTLPGGNVANPDTGASYYVMHAPSVLSIVNAQFNVYTKEITRDVFLSNSVKFTSNESYISSVFLSEAAADNTVSADEVQSSDVNIPHR